MFTKAWKLVGLLLSLLFLSAQLATCTPDDGNSEGGGRNYWNRFHLYDIVIRYVIDESFVAPPLTPAEQEVEDRYQRNSEPNPEIRGSGPMRYLFETNSNGVASAEVEERSHFIRLRLDHVQDENLVLVYSGIVFLEPVRFRFARIVYGHEDVSCKLSRLPDTPSVVARIGPGETFGPLPGSLDYVRRIDCNLPVKRIYMDPPSGPL